MSGSVQLSSSRSVAEVSERRKEIMRTARTFALVIIIMSSLLVSGSCGCPRCRQRLVDVAFVGGVNVGGRQLGCSTRAEVGDDVASFGAYGVGAVMVTLAWPNVGNGQGLTTTSMVEPTHISR
jgi:hypothetical protein